VGWSSTLNHLPTPKSLDQQAWGMHLNGPSGPRTGAPALPATPAIIYPARRIFIHHWNCCVALMTRQSQWVGCSTPPSKVWPPSHTPSTAPPPPTHQCCQHGWQQRLEELPLTRILKAVDEGAAGSHGSNLNRSSSNDSDDRSCQLNSSIMTVWGVMYAQQAGGVVDQASQSTRIPPPPRRHMQHTQHPQAPALTLHLQVCFRKGCPARHARLSTPPPHPPHPHHLTCTCNSLCTTTSLNSPLNPPPFSSSQKTPHTAPSPPPSVSPAPPGLLR